MMRTGLVTVIFLTLLLVGCVVYPGIGARFIAPQTVLQAFLHFDPQNFDHNVIVRLRLPRLAAALLTGASLGVAGALLQAVIRNPLGEPHILGLNAGAALAVVAASALGLAFPVGRPLLASTGGALLFLLILLLSSAGRSGVTPMKVTLCGVALSAFVSSITAAILILDEQTLLAMRTWLAGDLAGQDWATLGTSAWFSLGGFVLALYLVGTGRSHGAGAGRLCTPHANIHPACDRVALWRSRIDCWPHWFCRPASTADCPASGISGSARSAPSFSLCRRAFVITGRYYCPDAFHAP